MTASPLRRYTRILALLPPAFLLVAGVAFLAVTYRFTQRELDHWTSRLLDQAGAARQLMVERHLGTAQILAQQMASRQHLTAFVRDQATGTRDEEAAAALAEELAQALAASGELVGLAVVDAEDRLVLTWGEIPDDQSTWTGGSEPAAFTRAGDRPCFVGRAALPGSGDDFLGHCYVFYGLKDLQEDFLTDLGFGSGLRKGLVASIDDQQWWIIPFGDAEPPDLPVDAFTLVAPRSFVDQNGWAIGISNPIQGLPLAVVLSIEAPTFRDERQQQVLLLIVLLVGTIVVATFVQWWALRPLLHGLEQQTLKLTESEVRFRSLVEQIPDHSVIMLDAAGIISSWNDAAERIFGLSADEALGQTFETFYTPEDRAAGVFQQELQGAITAGYAMDERWHLRADGERLFASGGITKIETENGRFLGLVKVVRDLTERQRLDEQLRESNRDLEHFAALASHDLQEPLRTVALHLSLLEERCGPDLDPDATGHLSAAQVACERMRGLIRGLLELSTVGREVVDLNPIDSSAALDEALANLAPVLTETGAEVTRGSLPRVRADHAQLAGVFQNLIGNSIKYRREDVAPRIHIDATEDGSWWRFQIADNGMGMSPADLEQIFDIFTRLDRTRQQGTGLGLAICRKVIERHGGRIWVESDRGSGSRFYFTLPG